MRWERLWADLEAQAAALQRQDYDAEVAERVSIERASVLLMDRVRASAGRTVHCQLAGGQQWRGELAGFGLEWWALRDGGAAGAIVLVPAGAVCGVRGLADRAVAGEAMSLVARRTTWLMVLRRLGQQAGSLALYRAFGAPLVGRLTVVGRDYVELVTPDAERWVVPTTAVAAVVVS
jgi:hypothetical protein